ncbi:MAG TPA: hypothetical protein VK081_10530 [Planctomycetota bacterium]|nr:hypothetical protein [Planctomycetota bacterium]
MRTSALFAAFLSFGAVLPAQFTISEVLIDGPGSDDGLEFIEIRGPASTPLTNYYVLIIDGDGSNAGDIDHVIPLGSVSTGANGLLLIRDTTAVLQPPPDPATTVLVYNPTPDIENGTSTFVLGFGNPPSVGADLDADDDGVLDNGIPGFTTVDAVSITDGGNNDRMYARQLGGTEFPYNGEFTPDCLYRIYDETGAPFGWTVADVVAPGPTGPFSFDFAANEVQGGLAEGYGPQGLDPGRINGRITLWTNVYGVDAANGGSQVMVLDAGQANAGLPYLFLGSFAGTRPGIALHPTVTLPLNFDPYLVALTGLINTPLLNPSFGVLDGRGRTACAFTLPPGVLPPDIVIDHAAIVLRPAPFGFTFASTPARVVVQ